MSNEDQIKEIEPVVQKMRAKFKATSDQLIPLLQFVQGELGYLPRPALLAIADYLKAPAAHVYGVATFYAQFRFHPLGKNRLTVCRGTACHVRGSARHLSDLEAGLRIKAGETTPDLQFSLETVPCVGSCALAPVIIVNKRVYGKVNPKRMKEVLDDLRGIKPAKHDNEPQTVPPVPEEVMPLPAARAAKKNRQGRKPAVVAKKAARKSLGKPSRKTK